jgi:hypothetical protein
MRGRTPDSQVLNYLLKITPFGVSKKWLNVSGIPEFNSIFVVDKVFKVLMKTGD